MNRPDRATGSLWTGEARRAARPCLAAQEVRQLAARPYPSYASLSAQSPSCGHEFPRRSHKTREGGTRATLLSTLRKTDSAAWVQEGSIWPCVDNCAVAL